jgi:hypothetical protein
LQLHTSGHVQQTPVPTAPDGDSHEMNGFVESYKRLVGDIKKEKLMEGTQEKGTHIAAQLT